MARHSTQPVCLGERGRLAAGILMWIIALSFPAVAAEKQLVLLYNAARLPAEVMMQAEEQASRILREAGIELQWIDCSAALEGRPEIANCGARFSEHPLIIQVVGSAGAFPGRRGLAYAAVGPDGGSKAVVFFDRVEKFMVSQKPPCSLSKVLGHAIAHEMGHMLLLLIGHTAKGIMIGGWNLRQLEQAARGELLFTPYEAARMREEVKRRAAAAERDDRTPADALASR